MSRRGSSLLELILSLILLGVGLGLVLPGRGRPPSPRELLPGLAEWILHDIRRARSVLAPRPPPGGVVSPLSLELRLELPEGEVRYRIEAGRLHRYSSEVASWSRPLVGGGFEVRDKSPRGVAVRLRLVGRDQVLFAGERIGGCPDAP